MGAFILVLDPFLGAETGSKHSRFVFFMTFFFVAPCEVLLTCSNISFLYVFPLSLNYFFSVDLVEYSKYLSQLAPREAQLVV